MVEENIEIQKNKTYELNKHFWDTWVIKLPWAKYVLGLMTKSFKSNPRHPFILKAKINSLFPNYIFYESM
jgi:hypothetical protein